MTQIGFVGLGKMGGGMVHRIRRDSDNEVVAFDFDEKAVKQAVRNGAAGASSLRELVKKLEPPRQVWIMVPAGDPTQETVDKLAKLLERGDTIIDGGNSKWTDDKRRAAELKKAGIEYVDVGVSGGVWGLEVGYCMMVGGPNRAVKRLAPILDVLAPPTNEQSRAAIGKRGWMHFGPTGAGHYVKMVHNGVEYGLMQAYAEGFDVFDKCEYELDNAKIAHLWGQGSVVRSWLSRTRRARLRTRRQRSRSDRGLDRGLRRGPLDDRRRDRPRRADAGDHRLAVRALPLARQRRLRRPRAGGAAQPVRRPRRSRRAERGRGGQSGAHKRRSGKTRRCLQNGGERRGSGGETRVSFQSGQRRQSSQTRQAGGRRQRRHRRERSRARKRRERRRDAAPGLTSRRREGGR